jgi:DDE superfamily endonuclease
MRIVSQIVSDVLQRMAQLQPLSKPRRKFMQVLLPTLLVVRGKVNFTNLSRYCALSERTLRRQFQEEFDWATFNRLAIAQAVPASATQVIALDASFVPKSGKKTYGLDTFFNGCAGRAQKGLEVSLLSLIEVEANTAYALSVQQTPPASESASASGKVQPVASNKNKQVTQETRVDAYLKHLQEVQEVWPESVRHGVFDGYFAKQKFVDGVCELGLHVVSKLRCDANLDYLYEGPQKPRGAHRKYDGKVSFDAHHLRSRWCDLGEVEPHLHLYTVTARHKSLRRVVRVLLLLWDKDPAKPRYVLLFSTDVNMAGEDIYRFYRARFQMEFLFRDAKGWTGLSDCQARDEKALHFHFNAALSAVNLIKLQAWQLHRQSHNSQDRDICNKDGFVFSLASWKQRAFNEHLLEAIIDNLALEPNWVKSHPRYDYLCNYGAIATAN